MRIAFPEWAAYCVLCITYCTSLVDTYVQVQWPKVCIRDICVHSLVVLACTEADELVAAIDDWCIMPTLHLLGIYEATKSVPPQV
jgi:hypothetical protein